MLDVRRLRLLNDLDRLGTIAAVAAVHAYTPSAISQQLSVLEREAGVPLLERSHRKVALTDAGKVLARHAATVLTALEETTAALAAVRSEASGRIRIGAHPVAVGAVLPAALVMLGRDHPGLELSVSEWDPAAVPTALRDHRIDIGLSYDVAPAEADPALESVPLMTEDLYLAVAADTTITTVGAAHDADWILPSNATPAHDATLRVCRDAGFIPRGRHRADDAVAVLALVRAGQGVAIVARTGNPAPPPGVRLIPVAARRRTMIGYRRGAAANPSVTAVIAALRAAAGALPRPADRAPDA